jgi:predicted  nucleic acid-binding Zn-ribbon protein
LFSAFQASTNEKFAAYEQRFADYETKLNNANSIINQLLDVTKTLAETPTGTPDQAVKTQNNFKVEKEEKNYSVLFS